MPLPMLLVLGVLAQAAPAVAPAGAAPASAPSEAELRDSPGWIRLPSDAEIAAAYPAAARRRGVSGRAVIACRLNENGRLTGCQVAEEAPAGQGFGAAALSLAGRFQMTPLYPDGQPVAGGAIQVPIHFSARRR
jgi:protein TonB